MKALVEGKANVDKEDNQGNTALLYAVKKMENLISEKQPQCMCKETALSVLTLPSRYRRILLFPNVSAMHL